MYSSLIQYSHESVSLFPWSSFWSQEAPAAAADQESESIPCTVVVLGIYREIIPEKADYQVNGGDDAMPQSSPETIGVTL